MIDSQSPAPLCLELNVNVAERLTRCFLEARKDLLRYLERRTSRVAPEDVLQETWLKLHERGDPSSWREPRAFLFTTAANLATDAERRETRADKLFCREMTGDDTPCPHSDPQASAEAAEDIARLTAALDELTPLCREAFLLNRIEALTHVEIATRLGISTKSVQRYVERALRHCLQATKP